MQKKRISIKKEKIDYSVHQSKRARYMRLTIYPNGELVATFPKGFSAQDLENFIRQKADWVLRKIKLAKRRKPSIVIPKSNRRDYLQYKDQALALARERVKYFGAIYSFHPKRISIRNQKSRWGSCSKKGNINLNYRIIHLPEKYLNYIIVHELCHLKEFSHSRRFWELVGEIIPDYKSVRKEFRNL